MIFMRNMEMSQNQESVKNRDVIASATKTVERSVILSISCCTTSLSQTILDPITSRRIFDLARDQQDELDQPDTDEDQDVIENDFTRPRTRDLEQVDEDDEEEDFQGFPDDEERELVRYLLCPNVFQPDFRHP